MNPLANKQPDFVVAGASLPTPLAAIPDPPTHLFCRGDPATLSSRAVAIVGSRRCTRQGAEIAFALARDLAAYGVNVVSGLAYGIDAAAHRGALAAGSGATVAVLGGGLGQIYPRAHQRLAGEIVSAGGALVTEHRPDEPPRKHHFPARMALEQGRDVMAVPSLVSSPLSRGCHRLIREGAALVECAEQVLEVLGLALEPVEAAALPTVDDPVLAEVRATSTPLEAILGATGLPLADVLQRLAELEIDSRVASHSGGYVRLP